jgi:GST-like protein
MIDFYTWSTPNGRKVSIMLEETGLPYTLHAVNIGNGDQHQPQFRALNLNAKIPVVVDHDSGITLSESGAILYYLAEKTNMLLPPEGEQRWRGLEWMMFQMGHIGPMFGQVHHFTKFNPGKAPYAQERYLKEAKRLYQVLDTRLEARDYLVGNDSGEYSIVDIATWPWVGRFNWQTIDLNDYPNVVRWYLSIAARPAVQKGWNIPPSDQPLPLP